MSPTSTALASIDAAPRITPDQLALIRDTIAQGATQNELELFLFDCQRQGVDARHTAHELKWFQNHLNWFRNRLATSSSKWFPLTGGEPLWEPVHLSRRRF